MHQRGNRLTVVVTAAVCAVVASYRSYTALAEWADLPADTALLSGIEPGRRPSESMMRRLPQAVDPDLLAAAIGEMAGHTDTPTRTRFDALGPRHHLRRGPLPDPHRHRPASQGHHPQRSHRRTTLPGLGGATAVRSVRRCATR